MENIITNHALERLKERLNVKSVDKAIRLTEKAWNRGVDLDDLRWVSDEKLEGEYFPGAKTIKVYANTFFVFSLNGVLITVIPMQGRQLRAYQNYFRRLWGYPRHRRSEANQGQYYLGRIGYDLQAYSCS